MRQRPLLVLPLLALAAALGAGCKSNDEGSGCPASGDGGAVLLDGSVGCGTETCTSGQLCIPKPSADASANTYRCADVPAGCPVCECGYGECAACLDDLCAAPGMSPGASVLRVTGRTLTCPYLQ